jgi:osmotically-inducible protein OsmY
MPDDKAIITSVRAALERDARVDHPREIAVSCQAGWTVLRGTVATPRQRSIAHEVARVAPGVRGVEVELHVDLHDRWEDGEVRGTALQALVADAGVPADRVDVVVSDGWLTLKGKVKSQSASDAAFATVSELQGVGGITNEIKVITAGLDG